MPLWEGSLSPGQANWLPTLGGTIDGLRLSPLLLTPLMWSVMWETELQRGELRDQVWKV